MLSSPLGKEMFTQFPNSKVYAYVRNLEEKKTSLLVPGAVPQSCDMMFNNEQMCMRQFHAGCIFKNIILISEAHPQGP